uniref:RNA polymerase sigma factor n=1 Tax=Streptomyces rochei TaxID=1928 RepID=UPI0015E83453|nr:hypothetical protein [Streptomyces rochei]
MGFDVSIVAERPAFAQVPVRESSCRRSRRVPGLRGTGPGGRRLEQGEDIPLERAEAERLAVLFAAHGGRVLRAIEGRLYRQGVDWGQAQELAEDLAAGMWLQVARKERAGLLSGGMTDEQERIRLYLLAKQAVGKYWQVKSAGHRERATDFAAPEWRALEAGPLVSVAPELPQRCREFLARLPHRMRQALVEHCYGVSSEGVADRLGVSLSSAKRIVAQAAEALRADHQEQQARTEVGAPDLSALPQPLRERLASLSAVEQDMLLLRCAGLGEEAIAERLKVKPRAVVIMLRRMSDLLTEVADAAGNAGVAA